MLVSSFVALHEGNHTPTPEIGRCWARAHPGEDFDYITEEYYRMFLAALVIPSTQHPMLLEHNISAH
jgi:hypothetical protein